MTEEIWNPELEHRPVDFRERAAVRLLKATGVDTDTLCAYSWRVDALGVRLELGQKSVYTQGPQKGKPKYSSKNRDLLGVTVSQQELEVELQHFETTTGRCGQCYGNGLVPMAWVRDEGTMYHKCPACNGTGKPISKE